MRCPDPDCGTIIRAHKWQIQDVEQRMAELPWVEDLITETVEMWYWTCTCPGCARMIGVIMEDNVATPVDPDPAAWCCPLCGVETETRHVNRGGLARSLLCPNCGGRTTLCKKLPAVISIRPWWPHS